MNRFYSHSIIFILAFASMSYEYILSHFLSILFGDLISHYILVTGLFIFFLGMGALFFEYGSRRKIKIELFQLEYLICAVAYGSIVLPMMLLAWGETTSFITLLCFVSLIGFLTGIELPLLMSRYQYSILAVDYLGMALAGVIFAKILLPIFGLITTAFVIILLNFMVAIIEHNRSKGFKLPQLLVITPLIILLFSQDIEIVLQSLYVTK